MTDNVVTLPCMDLCFGNCPQCHKTNGCYSVGRDHWYVCHTHRTKWYIGSNLFSCWRGMSEQCVLANAYKYLAADAPAKFESSLELPRQRMKAEIRRLLMRGTRS